MTPLNVEATCITIVSFFSRKEAVCDHVTYVGKVGNTTTDEENLAFRVDGSAEQEVEDSAGIVEGLSLGGSTRVLAVVGELTSETSRGDSISVDDGSTTTSNKGPDTALGVEDGELERSTGLSIHLGDVSLLLAQLTAERSGELHWWAGIDVDLGILLRKGRQTESSGTAGDGPLSTALELGSLIDLGSQIEEVNLC